MSTRLCSLLFASILVVHCWSNGIPDHIVDQMWNDAHSYQVSQLHQYLDNYHRSLSSLQSNAVELWVFEPHNGGSIAAIITAELKQMGTTLATAMEIGDDNDLKAVLDKEEKAYCRVLAEKEELLAQLRTDSARALFSTWVKRCQNINKAKQEQKHDKDAVREDVKQLIVLQKGLTKALQKASNADIDLNTRSESHSHQLDHIGYIKSKNKQFLDNHMVYEVVLNGDQYYRGRMLTAAHFRHQNEEPKAWYFTSMTTPNENQAINWQGKLTHWDAANSKPHTRQLWDLVGVYPVEL